MSKVMVVEDNASLREIYSIRITAEGYEVVSAGDGEEALAVAVREKPDLILSDVMMPKISGFDMLDILRSTPETANIKVVMMTALSAEDQRQRGERLGADRYLVKSQVGIEDVINTIHEVLGDRAASAPAESAPTAAEPASAPAEPTPASAESTPAPAEPDVSAPVESSPTPAEPASPVAAPVTFPSASPSTPAPVTIESEPAAPAAANDFVSTPEDKLDTPTILNDNDQPTTSAQ